jgi:toxin FitB
MYLSVITLGEIMRGATLLKPKDHTRAEALLSWLDITRVDFGERIIPVDEETGLQWGKLSAIRTRNAADCLIAATAIVHNLTLVTRNTKDFEDLPVSLLNPWDT